MAYSQEAVGSWPGCQRWWLLRVKATQHVYRRKPGRVAISWCSRALRYGQTSRTLPTPRPTASFPREAVGRDTAGPTPGVGSLHADS
jgi:hypothetical protein